jgi:hypothetical protein
MQFPEHAARGKFENNSKGCLELFRRPQTVFTPAWYHLSACLRLACGLVTFSTASETQSL